jgi:dihydrodipicolinate synthase/N-acetylneuraminate lyase
MISGVIPVAPTVFHRGGDLDLPGQRRVIDYAVDAGSSGICLLANYSEQFSLTDAERLEVATTSLDQAGDRVPMVITTSHYSARVAAERSRQAQDLGAAMVMLMPPFFGATLQVTPEAVRAYFHHVAEAIDIPIMLQDAPMSTTPMSVELMASLAREIPHLQYVKIETAQAADKLRSLRAAAGDDLPGLYDGEEGVTLIPDLDAGARGTMTSCMVPDVMGRIVRDHLSGDRETANRTWEQVLPLVHFENRQCGLRAAKVLLHEGGVIGSPATRAPFGDLSDASRSALVTLARRQDALILRWAS